MWPPNFNLQTPSDKTCLNKVPIVVHEELPDLRLSPVARPALHDETGIILDPGRDPGSKLSGKKSVKGLSLNK